MWFADEDAMIEIRMEKSVKYCFDLFVHGGASWWREFESEEQDWEEKSFESINRRRVLSFARVVWMILSSLYICMRGRSFLVEGRAHTSGYVMDLRENSFAFSLSFLAKSFPLPPFSADLLKSQNDGSFTVYFRLGFRLTRIFRGAQSDRSMEYRCMNS